MEPPLPNLIALPPRSTQGVSESVESSPKSTTNQADWDEQLPPVPGAKLRLMCSYGGHIVPRPHDKTLCYVGGETRIIVAERNSSLSELCNRLSQTLLDGRKFTLKYQLPNEDLDSLISVSNDEDLENMIDEYDRIAAANSFMKPAQNRLRLFLFLAKPETAQTMGALLEVAQSETWFVDVLNRADVLPRGFSDSAAVGDLLRLDSGGTSDPGLQLPPDGSASASQAKAVLQDLHSTQSVMSDSPMVETSQSSFDSSTSSPSMAHLPPILVRVEEMNYGTTRDHYEIKCGGGLEEHFSTHLRVAPPLPTTLAATSVPVANVIIEGSDNNNCAETNRDESSEHGVAGAQRKPPLPLTLQGMQQRIISGGFNLPSPSNELKHGAGFNLPSPDSVHSESSTTSGISLTKATLHQEHTQAEMKPPITEQHANERISDNLTPLPQTQNLSHQVQPTQDTSKYIYPPQQYEPHHQFIKENVHYIPTHTHAHMPSYNSVYAAQPMHHPQVDRQQYSMYLLPVTQTQPYNVAQTTPIASLVPPSQVGHAQPSVYPNRPPAPAPAPVAGTTHAQYQQYVGYNVAAQPMPGNSAIYGHYDYGNNQVYYTGQLAATAHVPVAASQYQSITPAQAAMIAEASSKLPKTECTKQQSTS